MSRAFVALAVPGGIRLSHHRSMLFPFPSRKSALVQVEERSHFPLRYSSAVSPSQKELGLISWPEQPDVWVSAPELSSHGFRTYISAPDRGDQSWIDQDAARDAVYANRRRIRGDRGKRLLRQRGERVERSFAHTYDTGGMRRTHLRGATNILKRVPIHASGFNLGLLMRRWLGVGTPRGLQDPLAALMAMLAWVCTAIAGLISALFKAGRDDDHWLTVRPRRTTSVGRLTIATCTPGC